MWRRRESEGYAPPPLATAVSANLDTIPPPSPLVSVSSGEIPSTTKCAVAHLGSHRETIYKQRVLSQLVVTIAITFVKS